jgi:hypothetical protein
MVEEKIVLNRGCEGNFNLGVGGNMVWTKIWCLDI